MMLDEVGCPGVPLDGIGCPRGAIGWRCMKLGATVSLGCHWMALYEAGCHRVSLGWHWMALYEAGCHRVSLGCAVRRARRGSWRR